MFLIKFKDLNKILIIYYDIFFFFYYIFMTNSPDILIENIWNYY